MTKTNKNIKKIAFTKVALATAMTFMIAVPAAAKPPHAKGKAKGHYAVPSYTQTYQPATRRQMPRWVENRISYSQAKSIALSRYQGAQYIDTYLNGNTYTVILVLPNTKKIKVKIDAVTGRIR